MALSDKVSSGTRYATTFIAGAGGLFVMMGQLDQDHVQQLVAATQQIGDGLQMVFGGASKISVILLPLVGAWMAKTGISKSGGVAGIKAALREILADDTPAAAQAKAELINATSTVLASPTPASDTLEVKAAILNAAGNVAELKAPIQVTSAALAAAVPSDNVVKG